MKIQLLTVLILTMLQLGCTPAFNVSAQGEFARPKSDYNIQAYPGWQNNYLPSGGSMTLDHEKESQWEDFSFSLEPRVHTDNFFLGIPIGYSVNSHNGIELETIKVSWWDTVRVSEIKYEKSPSVGISFGFSKSDHNRDWLEQNFSVREIWMTASFFNYEVAREDYAGVDVSGGKSGERVISKSKMDSGSGYRLQLNLRYSVFSCGLYHESAGDVGVQGLSAGIRLNF